MIKNSKENSKAQNNLSIKKIERGNNAQKELKFFN